MILLIIFAAILSEVRRGCGQQGLVTIKTTITNPLSSWAWHFKEVRSLNGALSMCTIRLWLLLTSRTSTYGQHDVALPG